MPCLSVYSTSWSLWSLCCQRKCICWNFKPPNWKLILDELDKSCIKEALSFKHMKWNCNPRSSSRHSRYLKLRLYEQIWKETKIQLRWMHTEGEDKYVCCMVNHTTYVQSKLFQIFTLITLLFKNVLCIQL